MIRLIVRRSYFDGNDVSTTFRTFDIECPEAESMLRAGGEGPGGFDRRDCIGVELIAEQEPKP